jgi:hypothetical protein
LTQVDEPAIRHLDPVRAVVLRANITPSASCQICRFSYLPRAV